MPRWYSRQQLPSVSQPSRVGMEMPELPLSGLLRATVSPITAVETRHCTRLSNAVSAFIERGALCIPDRARTNIIPKIEYRSQGRNSRKLYQPYIKKIIMRHEYPEKTDRLTGGRPAFTGFSPGDSAVSGDTGFRLTPERGRKASLPVPGFKSLILQALHMSAHALKRRECSSRWGRGRCERAGMPSCPRIRHHFTFFVRQIRRTA